MCEQDRICVNCDSKLRDDEKFCHNCGQKTDEPNLKFKHFISDLMSASFNLDSKIFLSLKLLLFKPAVLTKEFLGGKRTKYITPIRLYLVISLVYFFLVSINVSSNENEAIVADEAIATDSVTQVEANKHDDLIDLNIEDSETMSSFDLFVKQKVNALNSDIGYLKFMENMKSAISTGMFVLLPAIAFIFFLLFYRNSYYIQHLVFTLHLQSIIFIIASVFIILEYMVDTSWFFTVEVTIMLSYTFIWVKKFYEISVRKTIWKLSLFYTMLFVLLLFHIVVLFIYSAAFI